MVDGDSINWINDIARSGKRENDIVADAESSPTPTAQTTSKGQRHLRRAL